MKKFFRFLLPAVFICLTAVGCSNQTASDNPSEAVVNSAAESVVESGEGANAQKFATVNFAEYSEIFKFSAELSEDWSVNYIPELESINIYKNDQSRQSILEKSQIFIRHFKANSFLTLSTVNVLSREPTTVNGRDAVRYEIEKKADVPNFPGQPLWRNQKHKLIDIRASKSSPSEFYVFSYNPNLEESAFESFISSIEFPE